MRTSNAVSTVNDIINDKLKYNLSIKSLKADVIGFECRCQNSRGLLTTRAALKTLTKINNRSLNIFQYSHSMGMEYCTFTFVEFLKIWRIFYIHFNRNLN